MEINIIYRERWPTRHHPTPKQQTIKMAHTLPILTQNHSGGSCAVLKNKNKTKQNKNDC